MILKLTLAAALVALVQGQDYTDWIKKVDEQDTQQITFNCSEYPDHPRTELPNNGSLDITGWMFPDLSIKDLNFNDGRRRVLMGGWQLQIDRVYKEDFGVYHCMTKTPSGDWYLIKWGLNMRGPFFQDLWKKYEMNTIIGISAMGGFLVLCAAVYIVYRNQWVPEKGDDGEEESAKGAPLNGYHAAYSNAAYDADIKETSSSQPAVMSGYDEKPGLPEEEAISPPAYTESEEPEAAVIVSEASVHATPTPSDSRVMHVSEAPEPEITDTRF